MMVLLPWNLPRRQWNLPRKARMRMALCAVRCPANPLRHQRSNTGRPCRFDRPTASQVGIDIIPTRIRTRTTRTTTATIVAFASIPVTRKRRSTTPVNMACWFVIIPFRLATRPCAYLKSKRMSLSFTRTTIAVPVWEAFAPWMKRRRRMKCEARFYYSIIDLLTFYNFTVMHDD